MRFRSHDGRGSFGETKKQAFFKYPVHITIVKNAMKHNPRFGLLFLRVLALCGTLSIEPAWAQFSQQGGKLVGTGYIGSLVYQGTSVAASADGNTALVGATGDNNRAGAVWIFTRSGSVWTQQGNKLVGSGGTGSTIFHGGAVAISADGNTAAVGGYGDNNYQGAVWIFTRSGTVWTQQGAKLVGTGIVGVAWQGGSVAISGDGNTIMVGGYADNSYKGAVWVFTRSGSVWTQQGNKLIGTNGSASSSQGSSVSLSADGNTAIVGGVGDNGGTGAAWVFTRSGGVWTQQGGKLVGTGFAGSANMGSSVSLSADGNTAIVGGHLDNSAGGASWVFTRSGGVWTQQGAKLVGTGAVGISEQGYSVSVSGDGNTAIVGGYRDNGYMGASWVFTRSSGVWTQQGNKLVGTGAVGTNNISQGKSVSISSNGNTVIVGGQLDNGGIGAAWVFHNPSTSINEVEAIPQEFQLRQNYPNPFNPTTGIKYTIPLGTRHAVSLRVYDVLGREVATLVNEAKSPGSHQIQFDAADLASGVYLYRLESGGFSETRKLILLR